ncbi:hypothetical protein A2V71_00860 [Candidatus Berkelbacteria bacterium RBG_13_40_8]|uniref:Uncharacterized protein n=1 Tax=Candidatus Berkelbacteria bacterium RBG_13_40_8 TaxID=1797467 RepID=A0A1F5DQE7_9BACT|nr:MAG: hypothetical protein A2V71_00860 [Candidatus Berkelbacteria bacterium RBG_13_40_8]
MSAYLYYDENLKSFCLKDFSALDMMQDWFRTLWKKNFVMVEFSDISLKERIKQVLEEGRQVRSLTPKPISFRDVKDEEIKYIDGQWRLQNRRRDLTSYEIDTVRKNIITVMTVLELRIPDDLPDSAIVLYDERRLLDEFAFYCGNVDEIRIYLPKKIDNQRIFFLAFGDSLESRPEKLPYNIC